MIKKINLSSSATNDFLYSNWAMMLSLTLPFLLLFFEKTLLLKPSLIEESVKVILIFFLIMPIRCLSCRFRTTLFVSLGLAFSENIFYLPEFIAQNNLGIYFGRFIGPTAMHIFTMFFMVSLASWKPYLLWPAFLASMLIHYYFNIFVLTLI